MSDAAQSLREDIAFMRALAEEGRRTSGGGAIAAWGGTVYGLASLYHWSVAGALWRRPMGMAGVGWAWLAACALFVLALIALRARSPRQGGSASVAATAWSWMGWSIWTISCGAGVAAWRTHDPELANMIPAVVLALYAAAWMVAAAVYRVSWARAVGFAAVVASLGLAALAGLAVQYLAFAAAMFAFAAIPGLIFMLRARKAA